MRVGLDTFVEVQFLSDRFIGLDRQHQAHLQAAAQRGVLLGRIQLQVRRHIRRKLQVSRQPQQLARRHCPGPRLEMHEFGDLNEVQETLDDLARRDEPLLVRLERQPGQKEARYAHLLSGEIDVSSLPTPGEKRASGSADGSRVEALEAEVATLKNELAEFKATFDEFRKQFD